MVRLKNRYLLVNILYPGGNTKPSTDNMPDFAAFHHPTTDALTAQVLLKAIRAEVSELFGDYGAGAIGDSLMIKYLSPATSTFIVRVSRAHYRIAWAALSFMDEVPVKNGRRCIFRVVRVSGTVRKAEEEAIRRARELIIRTRRELGESSDKTLENMFGSSNAAKGTTADTNVSMVDQGETDGEEESDSDG